MLSLFFFSFFFFSECLNQKCFSLVSSCTSLLILFYSSLPSRYKDDFFLLMPFLSDIFSFPISCHHTRSAFFSLRCRILQILPDWYECINSPLHPEICSRGESSFDPMNTDTSNYHDCVYFIVKNLIGFQFVRVGVGTRWNWGRMFLFSLTLQMLCVTVRSRH